MQTATRRFEFDAAHRVYGHEGKCKHLHGHRYVAEVTVIATGDTPELDKLGRVVDFSVLKQRVGNFIDTNWDHATILGRHDVSLFDFLSESGHAVTTLCDGSNPTAENIARALYDEANALLESYGIRVVHVRIYETPNCWADYFESLDETHNNK